MARTTRIFYVADLHGSAICFRKFVNASSAYKADVLIVGGDIVAKTLTPIFPDGSGWVVTVEGERRAAHTPDELARLEDRLRDEATVPYRTTPNEWAELLADRARIDRVFETRAQEELRRWLDWAGERLRGRSTRLLIGLGNDDPSSIEPVIDRHPAAELTDHAVLRIGETHEMLTLAYSNPTPWATHRELSEEAIAAWISERHARLEDPARAIYNFHVPPRDTPLDLAPRLDAKLTKLMAPGGEPEMVHVGSSAVRAALRRDQPLLGLHGHIHESRGTFQIGRTMVINPGSAYTEGTLLGAVVDLGPDQIRTHLLTQG
jgi:Icc-related predicted phosphoesterase